MKIRCISFLLLLTAVVSTTASAQDINLTGGKIEALKDIDTFHCVFEYDKLNVGDLGKEANYIKKKRADAEKKEAGGGDKWEQSWVNDRKEHYEPRFIELFNKYSEKQAGHFPHTRYQLVFKTTFIEPGYNIGISRKSAKIDGDVWFVDTQNPDKPIAKFRIEDSPGNGLFGDMAAGLRIAAAYEKAGKELGKYIRKKLK